MALTRRGMSPEVAAKLQIIDDLATMKVEAGWFPSARYEDGTPVAYVAMVQEFGSESAGIPPRSFMRSTVAAKKPEWNQKMVAVLGRAASASAVLETLGAVVAGDLRETIASIYSPPLDPKTIKARQRRGNSNAKPLVDTRILLPTLTHLVSQT